jgi:hypothetical protein
MPFVKNSIKLINLNHRQGTLEVIPNLNSRYSTVTTSVECTAFIGVTPTPYRETGPPEETPSITPSPPVTKGDVDGSGSIDIVDALLTAQYYVGLDPANFDPDAGDVDCSGQIDIVDALLIAQRYVGLIESFPC